MGRLPTFRPAGAQLVIFTTENHRIDLLESIAEERKNSASFKKIFTTSAHFSPLKLVLHSSTNHRQEIAPGVHTPGEIWRDKDIYGKQSDLGLSILLQFGAAIVALKMIPLTGKRVAWLLISTALCLMALRRCVTLYSHILAGWQTTASADPVSGWITLIISAFMFAGIAGISPLFLSIQRNAEALRKSEEKYRTLFQDSKDAIYQATRAGRFVEMNEAGLELFGYPREEMIGMDVRQIYVDAGDRLKYQRELEARGSVRDFELRFRKKDGTIMDCFLTATVHRDSDGTILGYQGVIRDVTELKRTLRLLDAERKRFFSILNEMPAFVSLRGRDYSVQYANRRFREDFGEPGDRRCYEALEGRSQPCPDCPSNGVLATGTPVESEWKSANGRIYQVHKYPFEDVDGSPLVLDLGMDVTGRKQAEEALLEKEAKYRELVQNANSIILRMDTEGRVTFFNEFAQTFFGYGEDEILGRNVIGSIIRQSEAAEEDLRGMIRRTFENVEPSCCDETENVRRNGDRVWISWTNKAVYGKDGRPEGILCIGNDITEHRLLEEQYRQSQKMEAIGRLAGGIAHDFNNLLTIILGYCELLLNRLRSSAPLVEAVEEIKNAGEKSSTLVRQLLAFSRRQVLMPKILNLNSVVLETEKMLRRLIGEDIHLATVLSPSLGKVKADPGQIEQVILNLAVNARDAMPEGGTLTIETANVELDREYSSKHLSVKPGPYIMVALSDTGLGMDEETLSQIFDPFFTTKEHGKGTGLGLATVYGIVKQSEGNIWVYSEPGRGTTFKIYLPRVEGVEDHSEQRLFSYDALLGTETILLVEDDESLRRMIGKTLEDSGYAVLEASHGSQAVTIAEGYAGPIALMVTDVVMPGLSGRKLAELMAAARPEMKTLFISGYTENAISNHGVLEPGINFLQKPFTPMTLLQKVRDALDAGSNAENAREPASRRQGARLEKL